MAALSISNFAAVALGGAVGASLRWLLGMTLNPLLTPLPLGTLGVNILGGYLVGVAVGVFHMHAEVTPAMKLFVVTGVLGGLTTFSSFTAEVVERLLAGHLVWAFLLISLHLGGALLATWLGLYSVGATRLWG